MRTQDYLAEFLEAHGHPGRVAKFSGRANDERRIAEIYDTCRTPGAIGAACAQLRSDPDENIQARMRETEQALLAHFDANIRRQIEAALAKALDENNEYFQREREKLDQWAEDQILAAEQELHDTKARLKDVKRRARAATTVDEQATLQQENIQPGAPAA